MSHPSRKPSALLMILIVAVFLRVVASFLFGNTIEILPAVADQFSYHTLATRLVEGHGFTFGTDWWPATRAGEPTAHWSYLYTLYLSLVYWIFAPNPLAARLIQAVIAGILMPWLAYRIARRVFRPDSPASSPDLEQEKLPHQTRLVNTPRFTYLARLANLWKSPSQTVPLLAAAWVAFYGYFIYFAAALMTETFYITAILWVLDCALRIANPPSARPVRLETSLARPVENNADILHIQTPEDASTKTTPRRPGYWIWVELGAAIAIATLLRQVFLPFVPVLFLWIAWARLRHERKEVVLESPAGEHRPGARRSSKAIQPVLLGSLLAFTTIAVIIAPVSFYNYSRFGTFVLLNTNAGYAFYWSNHPIYGTQYISILTSEMPDYYELLPKDILWMNEAQLDRELMRRGIGFVLQDIPRYILLSLDRIPAYFIFWPASTSSLFSNLNRVLSYGLAFPFMLAGILLWFRSVRQKRFALEPGLLLLLFALVYSMIHLLSWAGIRYRLPVDAVTLIFAALGLYSLGKMILFKK